MYTQNPIRKNKTNILLTFFNSIMDQLKKRDMNVIKKEFINDLNEQRQELATAVVELEKAKMLNNVNKIQPLEIKVCSINRNITKDCEIFEAFFSYHPRWDRNTD
ncbi:MAG TPA: hypothetical protein VMX17_04660 [Candidatus Glassbacteria bacterium]|nr:hypothetical protein [Candidatus Glassbacteria bacterium]